MATTKTKPAARSTTRASAPRKGASTTTHKSIASKPPAAGKSKAASKDAGKPKATGKKAASKAAGKPRVASKATAGRSRAAGKASDGAQPLAATLRKLDASYEEPINIPVRTIVQEARELQGFVRKLGPRILAGSRLEEGVLSSLPARADALEAADARWTEHRTFRLPTARKKLREQAEELRADVIAALRHFVATNAAVQARVEAIMDGTDLADLVDDLRKLAPLVTGNAKALTRAQLPASVSERLLALAQSLDEATTDESSERASSDEARDALALRNRAYWWLREAMDEIRECGRHAFRKKPDQARLFRSSYTAQRSQRRASRQEPAPTPAP